MWSSGQDDPQNGLLPVMDGTSTFYHLPRDLALGPHSSSTHTSQQGANELSLWNSSGSAGLVASADGAVDGAGYIYIGEIQQQQQQQQQPQVRHPAHPANQYNLLGRMQASAAPQMNPNQIVGDTLYLTASPEGSAHATQVSQFAEMDAWGLPGWYSAPGVLIHQVDSPQTQAYTSAGAQPGDLLLLQHLEQQQQQPALVQQQQVEHLQAQLEQLQAQLQAQQLQQRNDHAGLQLQQRNDHAALQQLQRGEHVSLQQTQASQQRTFHHKAPQMLQQQASQQQHVMLPVQGVQSVPVLQGLQGQVWLSNSSQQLPSAAITNASSSGSGADAWEQQTSTVQVQRLLSSISHSSDVAAQQQQLQGRMRLEQHQRSAAMQQQAGMVGGHSQLITTVLPGGSTILSPSGQLGGQTLTTSTGLGGSNSTNPMSVAMGANLKPHVNPLLMSAAAGLPQGNSMLQQQLQQRRTMMPRLPATAGAVNPRLLSTTVRAQPPMWAGADWNPRAAAQAIPASGTGVFLPQFPHKGGTSSSSQQSARSTPNNTPPPSGNTPMAIAAGGSGSAPQAAAPSAAPQPVPPAPQAPLPGMPPAGSG